jgi:acetate kinase
MILTINAGSSNIKYAIYEAETLELAHKGQVTDIQQVFSWLAVNKNKYDIKAAGHRIVHGGNEFFAPTILNPQIISALQKFTPLAPLHQPHNLAAVEFLLQKYPNMLQVGCFDTAFHRTQHHLSKLFAIPQELTAEGIIRYGFHGLSYEYIASILESKIGPVANKKVIIAHLGNGASMCAMEHCRSVATSMGFSALDGLMMGTRCGNIDPGVLLYLLQEKKYTSSKLSDLLYHKCGLLGVSHISNDMQKLLQHESNAALDAIDLFCFKAAENLGSLLVTLKGCDVLVFTAGIGEHAPVIRAKICSWLDWLGMKIDYQENNHNATIISSNTSNIIVAVIPTDEEHMLAKHTKSLLNAMWRHE